MSEDRTRYQILYTGSSKIENFTAGQDRKFALRCKELREKGVQFTTWDTQKNPMSSLFKF